MTHNFIQPLQNKTVVITRARHQASEFRQLLVDVGAHVMEFPTIEIAPPESWAPLDEAIAHLHAYTWIVFTSANGVRNFMGRLRTKDRGIDHLMGIRLCAIGPRTAREIERENLTVHLVPAEHRAEAVVESLASEGIKGKKILLAQAKDAREILPRELENLGARVDVVPVYRTVRPRVDTSQFIDLLKNKRINAIAFTSASTVSNFMDIFASRKEELLVELKGVVIAVIGPITRDRAIELGLAVDISPAEYTIPALVQSLAGYFLSRDRQGSP